MSKLLENKQIIHIAAEILVLVGITFYFSSKNKKLSEHIEDLSQRLEDQEDLIQKHEQIIRQLVQRINSTNGGRNVPPQPVPVSTTNSGPRLGSKSSKSKRKTPNPTPSSAQSPEQQPNRRLSGPTVSFMDNEEVNEQSAHIDELSSEDDSDLDAEIADELQELQEVEEQDGLKKRI
jgi:hypothetical protein